MRGLDVVGDEYEVRPRAALRSPSRGRARRRPREESRLPVGSSASTNDGSFHREWPERSNTWCSMSCCFDYDVLLRSGTRERAVVGARGRPDRQPRLLLGRRRARPAGQLNAAGRTVILITHDVETAHRAQRIVRIKDGEIQSDAKTST